MSMAAALVAACGNSGRDQVETPAGLAAASTARGTLIVSPPARVKAFSVNDVLLALNLTVDGQKLLAVAGTPTCAADIHLLHYNTVGGAGEPTTASGVLMVPTGSDPKCRGPRPIVLYAHGTTTDRAFSMANFDIAPEGLAIAAVFAAQGYIVVAPDYAGYGLSTLAYHPYLNAEAQSKDMVDALRAARSALPTPLAPGVTDNGKLLVTGYSQGGFVAMATHRALQALGAPVTASAPMSGPYALAAFGDMVFNGSVAAGAPLFVTLLITGYQRAYGNLFANTADVFSAPFASGIESLLPSTAARSSLYIDGRLPQYELFSSTPPDPQFAAVTPATSPPSMAAIFALGVGLNPLLLNSYRLGYLLDMQANPDGGLPTTTTGVVATNPIHPLRRAFKANDLRDWTPTAPTLLCAGDEDPTVFYSNTQLMQGYWAMTGPVAPVTILDVDAPAVSGERFAALKDAFAAAKDVIALAAVAGGATDGGQRATLEAYHSQLVPPFCLTAVRSYFDDLR
ncbi:MAG: prolyl oligopeptidase family serine peptidase [Steroidobacteraceae bacterium]